MTFGSYSLLGDSLFILLAINLILSSTSVVSYQSGSSKVNERNPRYLKFSPKKSVENIVTSSEPEFMIPDTPGSVPARRSNDALSNVSNNITSKLGHNALLPCSVRNIGSYKILWLRVRDGDVLAYDNMLITQDPRFSLIQNSASESNLFIKGVRIDDSGEYACQLNTKKSKTKFVNLVVQTAPEFIDTDVKQKKFSQHALAAAISAKGYKNYNEKENSAKNQPHSLPKPINIVEGSQFSIECKAKGIPEPSVNWYVKLFNSESLIEFRSNTTKITVTNVTRNQYEYFECEANNNVPPSISKKFKINVAYKPEVHVSPNKVFVSSPPTQVKINCTVNSYPASDIIWLYRKNTNRRENGHHHKNHKARRHHKNHHRNRHLKHRQHHKRAEKSHIIDEESEAFVLENNIILNPELKYSIYLQVVNETFKQSSIIIDIEDEKDYGVYACFANNSAGSKSQKFYIYGDHARKPKIERILTVLDNKPKKLAENSNSESYKENKHYNSQVTFKEQIYNMIDSTILATTPTPSIHLKADIESSANSLFDAVINASKSSSTRIACSLSRINSIFFVSILSIIINFIAK